MAIPSGQIYLLRNVPLFSDYSHTIDFKDNSEQFTYFMSFRKFTLDKYTYVRKEREYISIDKTMSELEDVNYLIFRSADSERLYFAFVEGTSYLSPSASYVYYTIDVMQTYMFEYKFKASYIKQAHVDRWDNDHKPIYSKTDEGLDYGSEYLVESSFKIEQSSSIKWLLVSMKDYSAMPGAGHNSSEGAVTPAPSPFSVFMVPLVHKLDSWNTAKMVFVEDLNIDSNSSGGSFIGGYNLLIKMMNESALANYIQSITLLTYNPFVLSEVEEDQYFRISLTPGFKLREFEESNPFLVLDIAQPDKIQKAQTLARADWNLGLSNSLPTSEQWSEVKQNPYTTKRDKRFESKLLCYPYRYNLLTDWRNNPVVLKNEYMTTDKIEILFSYALSYNAPFRFWIKSYKKDPLGRNTSLNQPVGLEFPIISDAYYSYMLQNKNTIQANLSNAKISAWTNGIMGVAGGVAHGGLAGGLFAGVSGAVSGVTSVNTLVRSENAKQADLRAYPDTVISSVDSSFNIIDESSELNFYRMRLSCENEEILSELFNMTGYIVNRVEVPNVRSRTRFNYIQTIGANIEASFNQSDIQKIKAIYDKGVTIWHYNKDNFNYLDYSLENIEVNLL